MFGYDEAEIVGKSFALLFTPEDVNKKKPEKELVTGANTGKGPDQRFHVHKDHNKFFVDGTVTPLYDKFGRIMGFTKIVHKISENVK